MTDVLRLDAPAAPLDTLIQTYPQAKPSSRATAEPSRLAPRLVMAHAPMGAAAEAIRSIRARLMAAGFARGGAQGGAFALAGPRGGEGVSTLAANLALAFAQGEVRTLLVEANLRRPGLARLFGLPPQREGLAEALERPRSGASIARDVVPFLSVLPAGATPHNPQELIGSSAFARFAADWAEQYALVIYDAPGVLDCADASIIMGRVGAGVIAARFDCARADELHRVSAALRAQGGVVAGVVGLRF